MCVHGTKQRKGWQHGDSFVALLSVDWTRPVYGEEWSKKRGPPLMRFSIIQY